MYAPLAKENWAQLCKWPQVAALVSFTGGPTSARDWPLLLHGAEKVTLSRASDTSHIYENVSSTNFILPGHEHYQAGPAGVAHTRTLGFLRNHLGGPQFDLEAIWDEHCLFEFGERDVDKTMGTMVEEPYVNHIPTVSVTSGTVQT